MPAVSSDRPLSEAAARADGVGPHRGRAERYHQRYPSAQSRSTTATRCCCAISCQPMSAWRRGFRVNARHTALTCSRAVNCTGRIVCATISSASRVPAGSNPCRCSSLASVMPIALRGRRRAMAFGSRHMLTSAISAISAAARSSRNFSAVSLSLAGRGTDALRFPGYRIAQAVKNEMRDALDHAGRVVGDPEILVAEAIAAFEHNIASRARCRPAGAQPRSTLKIEIARAATCRLAWRARSDDRALRPRGRPSCARSPASAACAHCPCRR